MLPCGAEQKASNGGSRLGCAHGTTTSYAPRASGSHGCPIIGYRRRVESFVATKQKEQTRTLITPRVDGNTASNQSVVDTG